MAMPRQATPVGEFELLVLLATMNLGDEAYPVAIARHIETTGRKASRAAVLITLERLEDKDLVRSRYGDPTPERGGRPKRFFQVNARGVASIRASLDRIEALSANLFGVLKSR